MEFFVRQFRQLLMKNTYDKNLNIAKLNMSCLICQRIKRYNEMIFPPYKCLCISNGL